MKNKRNLGSVIFDVLVYSVMVLVIIVTLLPIVNILAISFSKPLPVILGKVYLIPVQFNLDSYSVLIKDNKIWLAYYNSIKYAVVGTFLSLLITSMMAYPLAVKSYGLRKFTSIFLMITMFFGGGMIPTYLVIRWFGMINTLWVMVIPGAVSAFNVFIYRTFFMSIPDSLRESARIDGANDIMILFRIIIPLSKSLLAVMALFSVVGQWNDFYTPLLYLMDNEKQPLVMILRQILMQFDSADKNTRELMMQSSISPITVQCAVMIFTTLPIMCMYPFLQKYFTKGIMIGSIKG